MAALDFPTATAAGQTFEADTGVIYVYVGTPPNGFWSANATVSGQAALDARYVQVAGDSMTGALNVAGNVGIGTISPTTKVEVVDTLQATANNDYTLAIRGNDSGTDGESAQVFLGAINATTRGTVIAAERQSTSNDHDLIFKTSAASAAPSERVRIDSSGNVGIGTASPTTITTDNTNLTLGPGSSGSQGSEIHMESATHSGAGNGANISYIGSDLYLVNRESGVIGLYTQAIERMRIDSAGNVGIGTQSPSYQLDVQGAGNSRIQVKNSSVTGEAQFHHDGNGDLYVKNTVSGRNIAFSNAGAERMRITSAGLIGINETNPGHYLDMNIGTTNTGIKMTSTDAGAYMQFADNSTTGETRIGAVANDFKIDVNSSEALRIDSSGKVGIGTSSPGRQLNVHDSGANSVYLQVTNANSGGGTSNGLLCGISADSNPHALFWLYENSYMQFATNGSERMRIDSSGRLGVGTTSPSQPLEVVTADGGGIALRPSTGNATQGLLFYDTHSGPWGFVKYNHQASALSLGTLNTERMRIDSSGNVGIANSSPTTGRLVVGSTSDSSTNINITSSTSGTGLLSFSDTNSGQGGIRYFHSTDHMAFYAADNERMRIDSSGRVGIGTSSPGSYNSNADDFVIENTGECGLTIATTSTGVTAKSVIHFADGTSGTSSYVGYIAYLHNDDALQFATSATERMRIDSSGNVLVGKINSSNGTEGLTLAPNYLAVTRSGSTPFIVNRLSNDGTLINFEAQNTSEGSISVSGTTVSYNGAHLARWSQLPGNAIRVAILRGTVLSNIDEMCAWGEESNEQLNRMKISDVEGDRNVSGVFQAWDEDDDEYTDDFYCAMTGDFIIRIGKDVTVERGDLLMSAGDGTAKPQEDDIIRSKTIAKVTSTHVSETYADGSYCVPCVLMAC